MDDTQAALDALNVMLAHRGLPSVSLPWYRDHFAFPARPFYAALGVDLAHEDWDALAREYHDAYLAAPKGLNAETRQALARMADAGVGQSIASALRQDYLDAETAAYGIRAYFTHVCGSDNLDGASKMAGALRLKAQLPSAARIVVIGDSLHDKEVADALGVPVVFCGCGSHAAWRLRPLAPTGDTLLEAVSHALRILR